MKRKLEEIHGELAGLEVYAMMGNDDWLINMPYLDCIGISFFAPPNPPPVPDPGPDRVFKGNSLFRGGRARAGLDNMPDRPI